jgi:hypothetical protein
MKALIIAALALISITIVFTLDNHHQSVRSEQYAQSQSERDALAERIAQPGWCETGCAPYSPNLNRNGNG